MSEPPADEREIFAGSLHDFVARRRALAATLRKRGEKAEAKRVAALKKPSVAVWAVNQLAGAAPEALAALLRAVERQRELQLGALDGSLDAEAFEAVRGDERRGMNALLEQASECLVEDGHAASKTTLDRVATILRRAALDPERREAVLSGCLPDEGEEPRGLEAVATELDPALLLAALRPKKPAKKKRRAGDSFLARTARAERRSGRTSTPSSSDGDREGAAKRAAAEVARAREEARKRERRRLHDKITSLREAAAKLDEDLERAQARRVAVQGELDAARREVRRLKRKRAEERERLGTLERQLVELDDD